MRKLTYAAMTTLIASLATGPALADGGNLYFGLSGEPSTMDASIQTGTSFRTVKLAIHRGLVNYGVDGELSPELAESYEISPDAKTLTFHLRDAKFHDGSPVTADDVKATFDRIQAADSTASYRSQFEVVETIEVVDPRTVRLHLDRPSVSFLHYLALPESVILPASWIAEHGANPNAGTPIGAGPFKFASWSRGRELVVEKFDDYYKEGKPHLDSVTYQFYADENTRVNAIKSGDVDIIEYVPARDLQELEADPDIRLESTLGPYMGIHFNVAFEPFSHPEVRRAVGFAINRDVVVNAAFNGVGTPIYGVAIPEGYLGYDAEKANYYRVDYDYARELLTQAGYPNGFELRLVSSSQYSFHQNTAVAIQSELAKIGITVKLDLPDWPTRMSKLASGDYDMAVMGTIGEITDPDWLSNHYYGGENVVRSANSANFKDDELDRLLDEGRATVDVEARKAIYAQFLDRALELTPMLFLMWRDQSYAVRETVSDFTNMPAFLSFQSALSLENTRLD